MHLPGYYAERVRWQMNVKILMKLINMIDKSIFKKRGFNKINH